VARSGTRGLLQALTIAGVVALLAGSAAAVCGDATGDGDVTVSDGVQALRAAGGLSSVCDDRCDVDASGSITVTDGVNILRQAAGLSSVRNCPDTDDRVASLIGHTLGVFGPLTKVGAVGSAGATAAAAPCENAGGQVQQSASGFTFDDCQLEGVVITGFLGTADGSLDFSQLAIRRLSSGDVLTLAGNLSVGDVDGNPSLSGVLDASTPILGAYVITFQQVVTGPQGTTLDGGLAFDLTDANIQNVTGVTVTLTGGTNLPVTVTFGNAGARDFTYHTDTDDLTPVSNTPTPTPTATPPVARLQLYNIDDKIEGFLNGTSVLTAMTGPGQPTDTGLVDVPGLRCGDNTFEFRVTNNPGGGGYTFGVLFQFGEGEDLVRVVDRKCGDVGIQGCDGNNTTVGEVAKDVTIFCVPCGPCTAGAGTCANPLQIPATGRIQIHGITRGASALANACSGTGSDGPESVFSFTPSAIGCYEFGTCGTDFDSQLSVTQGTCGGSGPSCFDDNQPCSVGGPHELTFGFFDAGQSLTIVLDGADASQSGTYTLDVRPSGRCIF
jgi:hypothetical protein